jgi:hypothetical protein
MRKANHLRKLKIRSQRVSETVENNLIDDLMSNENVSDESVHAIHQFLETLLVEFESKSFGRLRRYYKEQISSPIQPNSYP